VSAVSAKSLEGGILVTTPLVGPRPGNPRIFALAQGPLTLNASGPATVGIVHDGCRLEEDFSYTFDDDGHVTLVIDRHHAGFPTAYEIQEALNGQGEKRRSLNYSSKSEAPAIGWENIAEAVDPANVRVRIPEVYQDYRVKFIAEILDTQVALQRHDARVVINERNGVIIVGDNVMVGRVAVTHKNVSIQTGDDPSRELLRVVDQNAYSAASETRLKALVDALNALKVDSQSIIDIIKSLERSGDLYGRLIVE
jgi:flagellar P-ring protein precursor FlgI